MSKAFINKAPHKRLQRLSYASQPFVFQIVKCSDESLDGNIYTLFSKQDIARESMRLTHTNALFDLLYGYIEQTPVYHSLILDTAPKTLDPIILLYCVLLDPALDIDLF